MQVKYPYKPPVCFTFNVLAHARLTLSNKTPIQITSDLYHKDMDTLGICYQHLLFKGRYVK